jgi:hypothetical protein
MIHFHSVKSTRQTITIEILWQRFCNHDIFFYCMLHVFYICCQHPIENSILLQYDGYFMGNSLAPWPRRRLTSAEPLEMPQNSQVNWLFFKLIYYTDSRYKVYKDNLQNCCCNQFHCIGTCKQVETNSMTNNRGGNKGSESWIKKTLRLLMG